MFLVKVINMQEFKKVEIIAYRTVDGNCRIEYKNYIIQTYGYDDGSPDVALIHFIIDENGQDVGEKNCLIDALNFIDRNIRNKC